MPSYSVEELKEYCLEHNVELLQNYDKKANSKTFIIGKCVTENCKETFNKLYSVLLTAGAYCKGCAKINGQKNIAKLGKIIILVTMHINLRNIWINARKPI